jgi:two-component system chemotaxis response regulator CheY
MPKPVIACVDDQPEVLAAVRRDLEAFSSLFELVSCEGAEEALALFDELEAEEHHLAVLVTDQVMPGTSGVELLGQLRADGRFAHTATTMLTGQATQADTIAAINLGGVDRYLEKPWQPQDLIDTVKFCVTRWLTRSGTDHQPYLALADTKLLFEFLREQS